MDEPGVGGETWPEYDDAQKVVRPEAIAEIQQIMAKSGLFKGFIELVADAICEITEIRVEGEPEPDDPRDRERQQVVAQQALRDVCIEALRGAISHDFQAHFTRDILIHATAWALQDLKEDSPEALPQPPDDDRFHQILVKVSSGESYIGRAVERLLPAYLEMAVETLAQIAKDNPILDGKIAAAVLQATEGTAAAKKRGRRRLGLQPPDHPLVYPNEHGHRALIYAATSNPKAWQVGGDRAVLPTPLLDPAKGRLAVTLDHGADAATVDTLAFVAEMLRAGEDGTALKVLFALPALFFDHNRGADFNAVYETTVPDLMRYMGFKENQRGGFDREDQERAWRAVRLLARLWVPGVTSHTKNRQRVVSGEGTWYSPVIVLQGLQEGLYGVQVPRAVRYSLGKEFHAYFTGDAGTRTRMLQVSPKIMTLHGHHDLNALRLAVYYASQSRIKKAGGGVVRVRYGTLLEQAGVPIDREHPKRQFGRVIQWHEELRVKEIIGDVTSTPAPSPGSAFGAYRDILFTVQPPTLGLSSGAA